MVFSAARFGYFPKIRRKVMKTSIRLRVPGVYCSEAKLSSFGASLVGEHRKTLRHFETLRDLEFDTKNHKCLD